MTTAPSLAELTAVAAALATAEESYRYSKQVQEANWNLLKDRTTSPEPATNESLDEIRTILAEGRKLADVSMASLRRRQVAESEVRRAVLALVGVEAGDKE